jgi:hypothetical protein
VINVHSVTGCGGPGELVRVDLVDLVSGVGLLGTNVRAGAGGSWSVALKVPADATPGGKKVLVAACFETPDNEIPTVTYTERSFVVTATPTSPVPSPVPG